MTTHSTWKFYHETYVGSLPEGEYRRKAVLAHMKINALTMGAALTAPDTMTDALALCECRMIDALANADVLGVMPGATSVNNDGFAVSFSGDGSQALENALGDIARENLTFPYNLLCRAAVVRNVNVR